MDPITSPLPMVRHDIDEDGPVLNAPGPVRTDRARYRSVRSSAVPLA